MLAGSSVSVHVFDDPLRVAVIVTGVLESTPRVCTVNVALVEPALTVTVEGTLTSEFPELRDTAVPPAGAGLFNVTVPVG